MFLKKNKSLWNNLNERVFDFPGANGDSFSLMDYLSGILVFGSPRSGKTSFVVKFLLKAWFSMKKRLPAFISATRVNDAETIVEWAKESGREQDVVFFNDSSNLQFNLIEYIMSKPNSDTNVLADYILQIQALISNLENRGGNGNNGERYWRDQAKNLLSMTLELRRLSGLPLTWSSIRKIVIGGFNESDLERYTNLWAVLSESDEDSSEWNAAFEDYNHWKSRNTFLETFELANQRDDLTDQEKEQMSLVGEYWLVEIPRFSDRTLSIVRSMIHSITRAFEVDGILKDHFASGVSPELMPEHVIKNSSIVICGFNPKEHKVAGLIATSILKLAYESQWEARDLKVEGPDAKPVLICLDEFQLYLNPMQDAIASSTLGGSLIAQLFISQSIDSLILACGGSTAENQAKSLASNQNTKFFCAQSNVNTNVWASQIIGSQFVDTTSTTINLSNSNSQTYNMLYHPKVPTDYFTTLSVGSTGKVETIVFQTGRKWKSNKDQNFAEVTFTLSN